jgi:photosystem II CP43 chlorophyll apoprotein
MAGGFWHICTQPFPSPKRLFIWSGEAYLSYSLGDEALMGLIATYFLTVNHTVYPEVFYGPVGLTGADAAVVSSGTRLATSHFVLAIVALSGHIWHAVRIRTKAAGFDFPSGDFVGRTAGEVQVASLPTGVSFSDITVTFLRNLPIYRKVFFSDSPGMGNEFSSGIFPGRITGCVDSVAGKRVDTAGRFAGHADINSDLGSRPFCWRDPKSGKRQVILLA